MDVIQDNSITISFAKEVVDTVNSFLFRGARKKFRTIEEAAQGMKSVWECLEFPECEWVGVDWQRSGIEVLNKIISGELCGFDAEDHLHGVNGMFNQTCRDASNVV